MARRTSGHRPEYFLVVCGDDHSLPPPENGVWGGSRAKGYVAGSGISTGDVLLLLQGLEVEGIGLVTGTNTGEEGDLIYYQYLPLCHPVTWGSQDALVGTIPQLSRPLFWKGNWIQKIGNRTFRGVIAGRQIDWP
jgi:hypothetical protein